jgi:hypothetical protein
MTMRRGLPILMTAVGVAAVAIAAISYFLSDPDPRPRGTIEDVLAFRERADFNVLFILVDTLRYDRLSAYGYERRTSSRADPRAPQ